MWDAGLENAWGRCGLRDADEELGTSGLTDEWTYGCVDSRTCGLEKVWTQGRVDSETM